MGLEEIMKCSLFKGKITRKSLFLKEFPLFGIGLAAAIVITATMNDRRVPGYHWSWLLIRCMYLPIVAGAYLTAIKNRTVNRRLYELPAWVAAIYVTAYNIYFAQYAGYLYSAYIIALVRSLAILSILPLTMWSFYGIFVTCGGIYAIFCAISGYPGLDPMATSSILVSIAIWITVYHIMSHRIAQIFGFQKALLSSNENQELEIERQSKQLADAETSIRMGQMAAQVAHDIRSPLSALLSLLNELGSLPERQRVLIRSAIFRINDIANNLLRGKDARNCSTAEVQSLALLVDELVSEKRTQYRHRLDLEISYRIHNEAAFLFAKLGRSDLASTLSNLIDNSAEAIDAEGDIRIDLDTDEPNNMAVLSVSDTGKGVPSEYLSRLTEKGFSRGKKDGHGLGLYQANQWIQSIGGELHISSTEAKGTAVILRIPISTAPKQVLTTLKASPGELFVVIDDDPAMRELWKSRLQSAGIELQFFTNPHHFGEWFKRSGGTPIARFVVDYEFSEEKETGLDLIKTFGIQERSFLVTSRYQESDVVKGAEELGIQILPKPLVNYVLIETAQSPGTCEYVLVDDDPMTRLSWTKAAERAGKKLAVFSGSQDLSGSLGCLSIDTPIYVDVLLKDGESGITLARNLIEHGYKRVFLTTGMQEDQLPEVAGLNGVIGKQPCFG